MRLRLPANFFFTGQAASSWAHPTGFRQYTGDAYMAQLARSSRNLQYYSAFNDRSPGFQADLGYIPRVDVREFKNRVGYLWWPEGTSIVNFGAAVVVLGNWMRTGITQDWMVAPEVSMQMKRLTQLTYSRAESFEYFQGQGFRKGNNNFIATSEPFKWLAFSAAMMNGTAINYYPARGIVPFRADTVEGNATITFRPTPRLRLEETYFYTNLRTRGGWDFVPVPTALFTNHIVRSKVNYQFTRAISLRAIVDYNSVLPNQSLVQLDRTKRLGYDLLFTYLLHPGTAFYAGYTDIYENLIFDPSKPPYLQITPFPGYPTGRQFFMKMSYLFRF